MSVEIRFRKGTERLHPDPNFEYQMNRFAALADLPMEDVRAAAARITSLSGWISEFLALAERASGEGKILHAAGYYRLVDFFLPYGDPGKAETYARCASLFKAAFAGIMAEYGIVDERVEYEDSFLPVLRAPARSAEPRGTVVITGGFDCIKEEMIPVIAYFSGRGYDTLFFEGPGQGEALHMNGMAMVPEWERPVKAVLDCYRLDRVVLIGLSLGSCLALRAASRESRIEGFIGWGVMRDFFGVVTSRRGRAIQWLIKALLAARLRPLLDAIIRAKMRRDPYTHWGVDHGMRVLGAGSPSEYFKALKRFSTAGLQLSPGQDALLLAGAEDHFVPLEDFFLQARSLAAARSFTGRVFTREEGAQDHCQFGNLRLALDCMADWMDRRRRSMAD
jgi:pimeloyl-ACP methyl ester carboxylesterase